MGLAALQLIATLTATLFAGAALYISLAEHPARMTLETKQALLQWGPSYRRATKLQAPLALLSFASGTITWLLSAEIAAGGWLRRCVPQRRLGCGSVFNPTLKQPE